jgi:hypothetical protein
VTTVADLRTSENRPGLHVTKDDEYTPATGDFYCPCGESGRTRGDANVSSMVAYYTAHKNTCGGRK